jgi:hypothetical protein
MSMYVGMDTYNIYPTHTHHPQSQHTLYTIRITQNSQSTPPNINHRIDWSEHTGSTFCYKFDTRKKRCVLLLYVWDVYWLNGFFNS